MLSYVLGSAGTGKTEYCLREFLKLPEAVYFAFIPSCAEVPFIPRNLIHSMNDYCAEKKAIVNLLPIYKAHLDLEQASLEGPFLGSGKNV